MDIARIADALDYVVLGIEKLAALSTVLKRFDNLDPQHPIRDFTMRYNINLMECPDVEEMRFEIGLGITMAKLEQNDIPGVDKDCVRKFLETGFVLEKRDLEAMKAIHDAGGDPAKYLEKIIETQKRPTVSGSLNTRTLSKNIMEQAQEIRDTVAELLKAPKITGDINIDRIDALIQDLNALKLRLGVTPPSETTPAAIAGCQSDRTPRKLVTERRSPLATRLGGFVQGATNARSYIIPDDQADTGFPFTAPGNAPQRSVDLCQTTGLQ